MRDYELFESREILMDMLAAAAKRSWLSDKIEQTERERQMAREGGAFGYRHVMDDGEDEGFIIYPIHREPAQARDQGPAVLGEVISVTDEEIL